MKPEECINGTAVTYWPIKHGDGSFDGTPLHTEIRYPAYQSSSGLWVCFVKGKAGYVLCSHLVRRA